MKAIVTGVGGFIGSHVAEELLHLGWSVVGLDDLSGGFVKNVPGDVEFLQRDCGGELEDVFQAARPDVVLHLAAYAAEGLSHHVPNFNYQNNLVCTSNVLSAAYRSGAKHFVFTSSIAAYGHPAGDGLLDETTPCRPCDPYGIAKLACEQHIASFHEYYGGPSFTIFRPHNVFGPRQNIADPYRNVVGIFFRCLSQGLPLPVFGDGSQSRSFSYIDVVAKSIAASCTGTVARNQTLNVGGDQAMTVLELAQLMQRVTGQTVGIEHLPPRQEVMHAHADHTLARRLFPDIFARAVSIEEGLQRTAKSIEGLPIPAPTPCPASIEIADRLPESWKSPSR